MTTIQPWYVGCYAGPTRSPVLTYEPVCRESEFECSTCRTRCRVLGYYCLSYLPTRALCGVRY
eukprot:2311214-Rhodomonas_salina.1